VNESICKCPCCGAEIWFLEEPHELNPKDDHFIAEVNDFECGECGARLNISFILRVSDVEVDVVDCERCENKTCERGQVSRDQ
jgi:hypothetical protein